MRPVSGACLNKIDIATGQLTPYPESDLTMFVRYHPDGKRLFTSLLGKSFLKNLETGQTEPLLNAGINDVELSSDGKYAYYLSEGKIMRADLESGRNEEATQSRVPITALHVHNFRLQGFWLGLTENDEPMVLKDSGSQEIYSLTWPVR